MIAAAPDATRTESQRGQQSLRWVPVLMYHRVVDRAHRPDPNHLCISTAHFESQMAYLRKRGYQPISLDDLPSAIGGTSKWKKPVAITFDDGYRDTYTHALPILKKYRLTATIMLVYDCIGGSSTWDAGHREPAPLLTKQQIAELVASGMRFGSHGNNHAFLPGLTIPQARAELADSKRNLEQLIGGRITTFAYPYGRSTPEIQRLAEEAGYAMALGVDHRSVAMFNYSRIDAAQFPGDTVVWRLKVAGIYERFRRHGMLRKFNDIRKSLSAGHRPALAPGGGN